MVNEVVGTNSPVQDQREVVWVVDWAYRIFQAIHDHPMVQGNDGRYRPSMFVDRKSRQLQTDFLAALGDLKHHNTESGFYEAQRLFTELAIISECKDRDRKTCKKINPNVMVKPESEKPGFVPSVRVSSNDFLASKPPKVFAGEMDLNLPLLEDELPEPPETEPNTKSSIVFPQERLPRAKIELPNSSGPPTIIIIW